MSMHFSTTVPRNHLNSSFTTNNDDDSVVSTASSVSDSELEDGEISKDKKAAASTNNNDIEANAKPAYPSTVNQIVNALSVVGTFGGLALITTGGMGMTLSKPIDNTMENMAMVLTGGALLVGSWVGNIAHAKYQTA